MSIAKNSILGQDPRCSKLGLTVALPMDKALQEALVEGPMVVFPSMEAVRISPAPLVATAAWAKALTKRHIHHTARTTLHKV
jgi:hypothetical protein